MRLFQTGRADWFSTAAVAYVRSPRTRAARLLGRHRCIYFEVPDHTGTIPLTLTIRSCSFADSKCQQNINRMEQGALNDMVDTIFVNVPARD